MDKRTALFTSMAMNQLTAAMGLNDFFSILKTNG